MNRRERKARESLTDLLGGKKNCIAMAIVAALIIGGTVIYTAIENRARREAQYIASWPITINQHIELGYAMKGGTGK